MGDKVIVAVWGADRATLTSETFLETCAAAGVGRLQVNVSDEPVAGAMRIREVNPPIDGAVSFWADDPQPVIDAVARRVGRVAAWAVTERAPLNPDLPRDGTRVDALANLAFLRRPTELERVEWLRLWLDEHTSVAIETQATFGYYQNIVDRPLTDDPVHVDAIVEELFPMAAVSDVHAFYGSGGDQRELERRLTEMLASVARFGADRHLDVVPTSRYDFELGRR